MTHNVHLYLGVIKAERHKSAVCCLGTACHLTVRSGGCTYMDANSPCGIRQGCRSLGFHHGHQHRVSNHPQSYAAGRYDHHLASPMNDLERRIRVPCRLPPYGMGCSTMLHLGLRSHPMFRSEERRVGKECC